MARSLFALIHTRGHAWDHSAPLEGQPEWNAHAAFMDNLVADGFIVLGGPLEGSSEVLLIFRADSEQQIEERLAHDPWHKNGLLVTQWCRPWRLRLGYLA